MDARLLSDRRRREEREGKQRLREKINLTATAMAYQGPDQDDILMMDDGEYVVWSYYRYKTPTIW